MFDLTGHVALVTGAGQNVGAGIALALAGQGAALAVNDFHADRAQRVADEICQAGGQAVAIPFDVTDLAAVTAGFAEATALLGPVLPWSITPVPAAPPNRCTWPNSSTWHRTSGHQSSRSIFSAR